MTHLLILGCGFTGGRVAQRFLARGARITATHRNWTLDDIRRELTPGVLVLHSIPPPVDVLGALGDAPARVVYLSTTGVYGNALDVNENTPVDRDAAPLRLAEERRVAAGPWSSLILRPAAIYGPGRGVHEHVKQGSCDVSENFVSRIHVDDLAAHVEAGLLSEVTGAYPVADEEPCTSREIAEFCAGLLGVPMPAPGVLKHRANRRVDGSAIRRALGVALMYPSYRVGIPAALTPQPLPRR